MLLSGSMIVMNSGRRATRVANALSLAVALAVISGPAGALKAADVVKANNNDLLNAATSWVGGAVPTTADVALFNATATGAISAALGDSLQSWAGIRMTNPGGPVTITQDGNLLTVGAGGIDLSAGVQPYNMNANLALGASQTWSVGASSALNVNGVVSGTGDATIAGPGAVTMTNANTWSGGVILSGGKLNLNFTAAGAVSSNILSNAATVNFGGLGSVLTVKGGLNAATNSQAVASTVFGNPGMNTLIVDPGTGTMNLDLGALSRLGMGSMIRIIGPATGITATINDSTASGVGLMAPAGAGGSLIIARGGGTAQTGTQRAPFATYGYDDWAGFNGASGSPGTIVPAATISAFYNTAVPNNQNVAYNLDFVANATSGNSTTVVNTFRFNTPGADLFAIRTVWGIGGILVTPNMGQENVSIVQQASGNLASSRENVSCELPVWQNNTSALFTLSVPLVNVRTGTTSMTYGGIGTTVVTGINSYTGQTNFADGFMLAGSNSSLGAIATGATLNFYGGALVANASFALDNAGNNQRVVNVGTSGGTLAATAGNTVTVSGVLQGSGPLKIGTGTLPGTGANTANATAIVGSGSVVISGSANTFTGLTTVNAGSLLVANTAGTALGKVVVNTGATFGGTGIIGGSATINSGGHLSAGISGVNSGVGTVSMVGLTMNSGSILDWSVSTAANDLILSTGGLNLSSGVGMNIFSAGTTSPYGTNGTYNVFQVSGGNFPTDGQLQSEISILNAPTGGVYTWGHSGSFITVTITGLANVSGWNNSAGGSWGTPGNWSGGIPGAAGDTATFGAILASNGTVTLDGSRTVGLMSFNNPTASYTIAPGSGGSLVLDNKGGTASVTVGAGSHTIAAPVTLNSDLLLTTNSATAALAVTGNITAITNITINGTGTVTLAGANSYNNTTLNAGSNLQIGSGGTTGTLGSGNVADAGNLIINHSDAVSIANTITGAGTLTNAGAGATTVSAVSGLTGTLAASAGKLSVAAGTGIGAGKVAITGGTLDIGGNNATLTGITLSGTGVLDNQSATPATVTLNLITDVTLTGQISSTGGAGALNLVKSGLSMLTLGTLNTYSGTTTITGGLGSAIHVISSTALQNTSQIFTGLDGQIRLANGVVLDREIHLNNNQTFEFVSVDAGASATLSGLIALDAGQMRLGTTPTGTLTITGTVNNTASGFTFFTFGNFNLAGNGTMTANSSIAVGRGAAVNLVIKDNFHLTNPSGMTMAMGGGANPSDTMTIQDSAVVDLSPTGSLELNGTSTTTTLNLNGGSLILVGFTQVGGTTTVNLNGTVIRAAADNGSFMPGTPTVAVGDNGAIFDVDAHQVVLGAGMSASGTNGSLTVLSTTGGGQLQLNGGITIPGAVSVPSAVTLNFNGNTHSTGAVTGAGEILESGGAQVTTNAVSAHSLTINDGGTHTLRANGTSSSTSMVGTLAIQGTPDTWNGKLEMNNNALVVQTDQGTSSKLDAISALQNQVKNGVSGTANGITSASVIADPTHKLMVVVDNQLLGLTLFNGVAVDTNSVLVEATYFGDANVDRKVDVTDLGTLATNYGKNVVGGIIKGDFNQDGKVDVTDLGLLATDYGLGTTGGGFAASAAAVPEPASLAVLAIGGAAMLVKRRRR